MRVLIDTNLITRLTNPANESMHQVAEACIEEVRRNNHVPCLLPQNLYEFWSVATRPLGQNGLGMSPNTARTEVNDLLSLFLLLQDERAIFSRWLDLVTNYEVKGKPSHDARIVAGMVRHGLSHLISFNHRDFIRYSEVTVHQPTDVISDISTLLES